MSHVTRMSRSSQSQRSISHIMCMDESCHTYEWSRNTNKWVISHKWISQISGTGGSTTSHVWIWHVWSQCIHSIICMQSIHTIIYTHSITCIQGSYASTQSYASIYIYKIYFDNNALVCMEIICITSMHSLNHICEEQAYNHMHSDNYMHSHNTMYSQNHMHSHNHMH